MPFIASQFCEPFLPQLQSRKKLASVDSSLTYFELPTVPGWSGANQLRATGDALESEMLCVFILDELIVESSN